jgi:hypothetical protein
LKIKKDPGYFPGSYVLSIRGVLEISMPGAICGIIAIFTFVSFGKIVPLIVMEKEHSSPVPVELETITPTTTRSVLEVQTKAFEEPKQFSHFFLPSFK